MGQGRGILTVLFFLTVVSGGAPGRQLCSTQVWRVDPRVASGGGGGRGGGGRDLPLPPPVPSPSPSLSRRAWREAIGPVGRVEGCSQTLVSPSSPPLGAHLSSQGQMLSFTAWNVLRVLTALSSSTVQLEICENVSCLVMSNSL